MKYNSLSWLEFDLFFPSFLFLLLHIFDFGRTIFKLYKFDKD